MIFIFCLFWEFFLVYMCFRRCTVCKRRRMKLTSAPLFWKEITRGVNCSWETWHSRWVLSLFLQFKGYSWLFQKICSVTVHQISPNLWKLSCQVRVLLIELEEARGNHVLHEEDMSTSHVSSTSEVISQHLVTFRSIEELQKQNQRLLVAFRELSDAQEKEEFEATGNKYVRVCADFFCFLLFCYRTDLQVS